MTKQELREAISLKREWVRFYKGRLKKVTAQYMCDKIFIKRHLEFFKGELEALLAQKERSK